jgi:hypothetical protein
MGRHHKQDNKSKNVVAERALELSGEEAPEATERSHWPTVGWVCVFHFLGCRATAYPPPPISAN